MARIEHLHIQNFRGIENLDCDFSKSNMCCIIGHCDSGKTTILTAIAHLFSSSWTIPICDEDFHNMDVSKPIIISGIVSGIPKELMTIDRIGLDAFRESEDEGGPDLLEIVLTIEQDLDPRWEVHNQNSDEYHPISNKERALFNIRMIDDYFDTQFNMSKYSLLKELVGNVSGKNALDNTIGIDLIRSIKDQLHVGESIDENVSAALNPEVSALGGEERNYNLAVPSSELLLRGNQISLQADNVPVKLLGKGSRRQLSLALQMALSSSESPVILIDEVEQGLEPYKVKTIVRTLKDSGYQVFITTHSATVLCELDATDLYLKKCGATDVYHLHSKYQQLLRTNPDAFFFDNLIICEGETEYGFILELDRFIWKKSHKTISSFTASPIVGKGDNIIQYVKGLHSIGLNILCFIDNDKPEIVEKIKDIATICNCEPGNSIEQQYYKDAPESSLAILIHEAQQKCRIPKTESVETIDRIVLGERSKGEEWYKSVGGGRFLGQALFEHYDELDVNSCLFKQIQQVLNWIMGSK